MNSIKVIATGPGRADVEERSTGRILGFVERTEADFNDPNHAGRTVTRRGWQAVRQSDVIGPWSAGQFLNQFPTRREAVTHLTGK